VQPDRHDQYRAARGWLAGTSRRGVLTDAYRLCLGRLRQQRGHLLGSVAEPWCQDV
jgi:hypothetical protein